MKIILRYCGLAALLAGAALYFSNCDGDGPTGPEPVKSVWEWVPTPKCLAPVRDICFVNPNDGWAVAGHQIWHYDGSRWKLFKEVRPADPRYDYGLTQVWFNGPNDGWVAGIENRTYSVYVSHMWHYDGSSFSEVEIPDVRFIYTLHFNAPDDGWALGGDYALRFDGNKWYKTEFPTLSWGGCFFWNASDGWAVSRQGIHRWDGEKWGVVKYVDSILNCIGFADRKNGWAMGEGSMSAPRTKVWHYDGNTWSEDENFAGFDYFDVRFLNADYAWAVGTSTFHWDGKAWKRFYTPRTEGGRGFYCTCVFIINEKNVWVGGDEGTIIRFNGFGNER